MASVLQSPEDTISGWPASFQPLEGAHFQRSFKRFDSAPDSPPPRDEGQLCLDATVLNGHNTKMSEQLKSEEKDTTPEVCIPTNPGTLLHPGSCTPCAFVFRVAEGQVRNRCTNGDDCGWCHHPSHPRTRGRRQKNGTSRKEALQQQEAWTDKNGGGSETSTRDSSDRDTKAKTGTSSEGDDHPKSNRSTKEDRGNAKINRAVRDDRAKNNRQQRNGREDRSKNSRIQSPHEKVERCNTPEFDEQYACYRAPHGAPDPVYHNHISPNQGPQPGPQDDYIRQPTPILYSCIPVHVAVPTQPAEGMTEWPGYVARDTYGRDTYGRDTYSRDTYVRDTYAPAQYVPDYDYPPRMYQPEVQPYGSQPYMMVPVQAAQWKPNHPLRVENAGLDRSREVIHG